MYAGRCISIPGKHYTKNGTDSLRRVVDTGDEQMSQIDFVIDDGKKKWMNAKSVGKTIYICDRYSIVLVAINRNYAENNLD